MTLVRCPEASPSRAYQKHRGYWAPESIRRVRIQEKTKFGDYLVVDDVAALVGLAQIGIVEIHTWNARVAHLESPIASSSISTPAKTSPGSRSSPPRFR